MATVHIFVLFDPAKRNLTIYPPVNEMLVMLVADSLLQYSRTFLAGLLAGLDFPFSSLSARLLAFLSGIHPWEDCRGFSFHYVVRVYREEGSSMFV